MSCNHHHRQLSDTAINASVVELSARLSETNADRIFIVTDSNVAPMTSPFVEKCREVAPADIITVPAGEANKSLSAVASICDNLSASGATRHSLIVNIGGGMISDLGGFAAAIFKRGIRYINVATTILAAVDAAIGGKTGIDTHAGPSRLLLKNEIGAFHKPLATIIASPLFASLPMREILSGFGEVLKTTMLFSPSLYSSALATSPSQNHNLDNLVTACGDFKRKVTELDPTEKGLRRILNLGHTAGHAFESILLDKGTPLPHGVCVAHGLLVALILSHICLGLESTEIYRYRDYLRETFPSTALSCRDLNAAEVLMAHDKKNRTGQTPSFVLLRAIGDPVEAYSPSPSDISQALNIYLDLL